MKAYLCSRILLLSFGVCVYACDDDIWGGEGLPAYFDIDLMCS